jgi:hypothetical protein
MTQATTFEHVAADEGAVAFIEGTNVKVIELVVEMSAYD